MEPVTTIIFHLISKEKVEYIFQHAFCNGFSVKSLALLPAFLPGLVSSTKPLKGKPLQPAQVIAELELLTMAQLPRP